MIFRCSKTYGHEQGLSCTFRQHRAESHCRLMHGYALAFRLDFETRTLDENGWVLDFGSLRTIKAFLVDTFDHKTLVAKDDPEMHLIQLMGARGIADVCVLPAVGCEAFAGYVFQVVDGWLINSGYAPRVRLAGVEVREHGANGASAVGELG